MKEYHVDGQFLIESLIIFSGRHKLKISKFLIFQMLNSSFASLYRAESFEHSADRVYKFTDLLKEMEKFLFVLSVEEPTDPTVLHENKHYFYQDTSQCTISDTQVRRLLLDIKKIVGKQVLERWSLIRGQISSNQLSRTYLKYLYGIFQIHSIGETFVTRILIWIYSLCYGNYENESTVLQSIIHENSRLFVTLGLNVLLLLTEDVKEKPQENCPSLQKLSKRFKKHMLEYLRNQQQKNHQEKFEICRICESHISVNLMHAHLLICQTINEKKYLEEHIEEIGRQLLDVIKNQLIEYDYLDERADTKLFFNRVYSRLGERNVIFQIKEDELDMNEVIEQFKSSRNSIIRRAVQLLERYYQNIFLKTDTAGYDSDDVVKSSSQHSKLKSNKYISRNSIRLSSNSLIQDSDSKKSSAASQKIIRTPDETFFKSSKNFHTIDDFAIIKLLGKGAYSEVYLVKNTTTSDLFAMKVVQVESINTETLQALKKQQQIYKKISSQFAIQLYESFSDQNLHFFILEYASGGNLRHLLQQQCYFDEDSCRLYLANLILALEQIHQMGIIHRDLKPQNIVIDESGFLKLTDFNLAFMLTANQQQEQDVDRFFGSPDYIAPEVIKSELNHPSRDIWSLGIIAYEILIGVTPFTAMEVQEVFQNILKGDILWPQIGIEEGMISHEAQNFISSLLQPNPYKRLGFKNIAELKAHSFFNNINWANIRQHKPYFVPKREGLSFDEDVQLKQRLLQRKTTSKASIDFPSLGCIIRYDVLKSKSSLKAKSTRKSRFKMQKQLNELKVLTSMDSFPTPDVGSQKSLNNDSKSSSQVFQSEQPSNTTIQLNEVSNNFIQATDQSRVKNENMIHKELEDDYEIKVTKQGQISTNAVKNG